MENENKKKKLYSRQMLQCNFLRLNNTTQKKTDMFYTIFNKIVFDFFLFFSSMLYEKLFNR